MSPILRIRSSADGRAARGIDAARGRAVTAGAGVGVVSRATRVGRSVRSRLERTGPEGLSTVELSVGSVSWNAPACSSGRPVRAARCTNRARVSVISLPSARFMRVAGAVPNERVSRARSSSRSLDEADIVT